ncbi:hypothetical protein SUGI_0947910 [Cryptomeria japonica]|nr:hypothetical protein SUGI_0947910 [Cryptomeria japonica]
MEKRSGHVVDMDQSMKDIHEQVRQALQENSQRIKEKVDEKRKNVQFVVGDWVMVQLNKERLQKGVPKKIQVRRIGPCKVLAKYGQNAYKIDLPRDIALSYIFNVADLVQYKGTISEEYNRFLDVSQSLSDLPLPPPTMPQAEKVLDSRILKKIGHTAYMEHLVKWEHLPESEATWVLEA